MGESQEMQDGRVKLLLDGRAAPQIVTTALFCLRVVEKSWCTQCSYYEKTYSMGWWVS